jgi:glycerophosphoryl diester phosphodiesterase
MSIAKGDIASIEYVDVYSIEASNINYSMVESIHNANKEIYAWTINKEETITKMLDLNVDSIITDDVELAKTIIQEDDGQTNILLELIEKIFNY